MSTYKILLSVLLILPSLLTSQENAKDSVKVKEKAERPAFESLTLIDNPTNVLFSKKTLEVQMQHRFGLINNSSIPNQNDLIGFWAPSNIRIGLAYAVIDRLTVGFGTSKFDRLQDFNWKVGILSQTRSNKIPVSVSYYGNFTIDARKKGNGLFPTKQARYSYFNQLIIARRFSPNFSMQVAPSVSHYNLVENKMRNDVVAVSVGARYKISDQTSILVDYSQPFVHHLNDVKFDIDPEPGFSLGVEFATSAHAFQLFITNLNGIVPQRNYMKNTNDFFDGDILFGFNITRNYNF